MFLTVCDICRAELEENYIQIGIQFRREHQWYNDEIQMCLACYSKNFPFFKQAHEVRKQIEAEKISETPVTASFREELDKFITDLKGDEEVETTPF